MQILADLGARLQVVGNAYSEPVRSFHELFENSHTTKLLATGISWPATSTRTTTCWIETHELVERSGGKAACFPVYIVQFITHSATLLI